MSELSLGDMKINQFGYGYKDIKKQAKTLVEKLGKYKY
jgi:hypothetical protein